MVTRRNKREYSLSRVCELAKAQKVTYANSRRATKDIEDRLNFSFEDVCERIALLTEEHYQESLDYGDWKGWLDVYLIPLDSYLGNTENLYIKLKLDRDCCEVIVISFHPEGEYE